MLQLINILGHGGGRQEKVENGPAGGGFGFGFAPGGGKGTVKLQKEP